jgi:hypothetical protein
MQRFPIHIFFRTRRERSVAVIFDRPSNNMLTRLNFSALFFQYQLWTEVVSFPSGYFFLGAAKTLGD